MAADTGTAQAEAQAGPEAERNALGGRAASPLGQYSWAAFDWANQPYYTMISATVFSAYFITEVVGDAERGSQIFSFVAGFSGLIIALLSPIFGAIADASGRRKPWLFWFSAVYVVAVAAHWFAMPGAEGPVLDGLIPVILVMMTAGIAIELATVFNNAMLPSVAPARSMGWLSGFGFGIGYVGGLVALALLLLLFSLPADEGGPFFEAPLFGLDPATHEHERVAGPIAAIWYVLFILPLFLFTPDRPSMGVSAGAAVRRGLAQLKATAGHLGRYKNLLVFLVARMLYIDGLNAIFIFGSVIAIGLFAWTPTTVGVFGLILLIFAGFGSFVGGWLTDRLGAKPTLFLAIGSIALGAFGALGVAPDRILFVVDVAPSDPAAPLAGLAEIFYIGCGALVGLGGGPAQAASRTLMGQLVPEGMVTEFFGLYGLTGKATAWIAPLLIGWIAIETGSPQPGIWIILCLLISGAILLTLVEPVRARPLTPEEIAARAG